MALDLHSLTAAIYLMASIVATLGLTLRSPGLARGAVLVLAAGVAVHSLAFFQLHERPSPPPLTALPAAVSLMAWMGTLFFLAFLGRARLYALAVVVAPAAFLGAFFAALALPQYGSQELVGSAAWSHVHVLLASAGLALLGVAGSAGLLYLVQHHRIKSKRHLDRGLRLPSLEALDRVNVLSLSVGFLLITLGVVTGLLWVQTIHGRFWVGSAHAVATLMAWAIYALLVGARFGAGQGARTSAWSAMAGFLFLLFAVVGVGIVP